MIGLVARTYVGLIVIVVRTVLVKVFGWIVFVAVTVIVGLAVTVFVVVLRAGWQVVTLRCWAAVA